MSSTTVIGIPTDEKVFERNCVPLFAGPLNDPNVKPYGTRGKKQSGIDLIGRRGRDPNQPVGIQCKLITRGAKLTEATVRAEAAAALTIRPVLTEYYIVTTATDEPALDSLAIELSQEQAAAGRIIDIQVWGWDTLQDKIREDARALAAFDPNYSASTDRLVALGTETLEAQTHIRSQNDSVLQKLEVISASITLVPLDTARSAFDQHLDLQVDQYRDLMNAGKPRTALDLLEKLEATFGVTSPAAIRARVKANIAFCHLRIGDDADGADLLAQAYAINPGDPKVRANYVLALLLKGRIAEGWTFAEEILRDDPSNAGAAGLSFQAAAMSNEARDPMAIVPEPLLDDLAVRLHRISYLREKGAPDSWWGLAAKALERYPDDGNALRMAGDALIDEALGNGTFERYGVLPPARRKMLLQGAGLLQQHWDEVRLYENATESSWIMVSYNLITAYRALGDLDRAQSVSQQMLALGSTAGETLLSAAWVAIDRDEFEEAAALLRRAPQGKTTVLPMLVALMNAHDWQGALGARQPAMRELLTPAEQQLYDVLVFRARRAADPAFDLSEAVEEMLSTWPLGVAAHIAVADIYRDDRPEEVAAVAAKAKALIDDATGYSDRVMFAQLSLFREAWDDIIAVLDGKIAVDRPSEALAWLAFAFANGGTRPRTAPFFQSLAPQVIALARYARPAGAAEHHRGDLKAAEYYLHVAIAADPADLRAMLLLASTLMRGNREAEAKDLLRKVDDETVQGSAEDLMRLAHNHRRAGETERGLRLGYRIAAANRQNEDVMSSYPGLIFLDEALPAPIGRPGPVQADFWFDLEGLDGTRDVSGVIDSVDRGCIATFAPDHSLALALYGKVVGDEIALPADVGAARRYRVREVKHKYIWLLHDIMATHAARFPDATSMFEMSMKDGDVQPVLDVVRHYQGKDDLIASTYAELQVPLAAMAAMAHKPVLALAEHLVATGTNLRTCVGTQDEREEAAQFVRDARGKGAVLDALTVWQLRELGHLAAAKDYFGRLCIPQSSFDELLELRAKVEANRGREYMTLGFEGEQAWRKIHTPEETEAQIAFVKAVIADLETRCEILATHGSDNTHLERVMGADGAQQLFDPIHLAREQGLILLSEDLNLRQFAAQNGVIGGAWLQVVLNVLAADGVLSDRDYVIGVGMLGAVRHDHLWLEAPSLIGMLTLDDPRAFALYEAAIRFMGGPKAEMRSHLSVTIDLMRSIWTTQLPEWQKGRAVGRLLEQLVRSRPQDWKAMLHILDGEFAAATKRGDALALRAHDYLSEWITGHFYDLDEIRSADRVLTDLRTSRPLKAAKKAKPKPQPRQPKAKARRQSRS